MLIPAVVGTMVFVASPPARSNPAAAERSRHHEPLYSSTNEIATADGTISNISISQGKDGGYLVVFQVTPFGELEQSWELDVRRNGPDRQTTTLRIDGSLAYRMMIGIGREGTRTHIRLTTPRVSSSFSDTDNASTLDPTTVAALKDTKYYRQIIYAVLGDVWRSIETPIIIAATCASLCADEHPMAADCTGWWDAYQCCLAEADKDTCRRACECGDSNWCLAWEFIISAADHEACAVALFL